MTVPCDARFHLHILLPVTVVESARLDWESALTKFLRAKKSNKSALESPAMDAVMSLSRLELSRFDLISRLNLLEMNKRLELTERVCTALYSTRAFFLQCNEVIAELEPSMQQMLVRCAAGCEFPLPLSVVRPMRGALCYDYRQLPVACHLCLRVGSCDPTLTRCLFKQHAPSKPGKPSSGTPSARRCTLTYPPPSPTSCPPCLV